MPLELTAAATTDAAIHTHTQKKIGQVWQH